MKSIKFDWNQKVFTQIFDCGCTRTTNANNDVDADADDDGCHQDVDVDDNDNDNCMRNCHNIVNASIKLIAILVANHAPKTFSSKLNSGIRSTNETTNQPYCRGLSLFFSLAFEWYAAKSRLVFTVPFSRRSSKRERVLVDGWVGWKEGMKWNEFMLSLFQLLIYFDAEVSKIILFQILIWFRLLIGGNEKWIKQMWARAHKSRPSVCALCVCEWSGWMKREALSTSQIRTNTRRRKKWKWK